MSIMMVYFVSPESRLSDLLMFNAEELFRSFGSNLPLTRENRRKSKEEAVRNRKSAMATFFRRADDGDGFLVDLLIGYQQTFAREI